MSVDTTYYVSVDRMREQFAKIRLEQQARLMERKEYGGLGRSPMVSSESASPSGRYNAQASACVVWLLFSLLQLCSCPQALPLNSILLQLAAAANRIGGGGRIRVMKGGNTRLMASPVFRMNRKAALVGNLCFLYADALLAVALQLLQWAWYTSRFILCFLSSHSSQRRASIANTIVLIEEEGVKVKTLALRMKLRVSHVLSRLAAAGEVGSSHLSCICTRQLYPQPSGPY